MNGSIIIPANEEYFDKTVTSLELVKLKNLKDTKDAAERYDRMEEYEKLKLTLTYKKDEGRTFGIAKKWFKEKLVKIIEGVQIVSYEDKEYDEVNLGVKMGKKSRKINIFGGKNIGGRIDISDNIECEESGHPKISSIRREVEEIIDYIIERIREIN